jgi:metal-dependent HD superfamily phosphatase/phosphodiesterase
MKSPKASALDAKILSSLSGVAREAAEILLSDKEVAELQEYANAVAIKRLNYNDHGPVHMRIVTLNAIRLTDLLQAARIPMSLEAEELGAFEDSKLAVMTASFLHDLGMSIGRQDHELTGLVIARPIIDGLLRRLYPNDVPRRAILSSLISEGIFGHMATRRIHSIEAGLVLVADGCDMEKGRSRIPMMISTEAKAGDIHQYSSAAIQKVVISKGERKPIRISVEMSESVGFFQLEEVLLHKIDMSPAKCHLELCGFVHGSAPKWYL